MQLQMMPPNRCPSSVCVPRICLCVFVRMRAVCVCVHCGHYNEILLQFKRRSTIWLCRTFYGHRPCCSRCSCPIVAVTVCRCCFYALVISVFVSAAADVAVAFVVAITCAVIALSAIAHRGSRSNKSASLADSEIRAIVSAAA